MDQIGDLIVKHTATFQEALHAIDSNGRGTLFVVDDDERLVGSITDGDIRRGVMNRTAKDDTPVSCIMNKTPHTADLTTPEENVLDVMEEECIEYIPLLDDQGRILRIFNRERLKNHLDTNGYGAAAVIMCGGLGTRLGHLTASCPKPMIDVGGRPILSTIISRLKHYGVTDIFLAVNHLSHIIEDWFGDGKHLGVNIQYIREKQRLGTAGALALLRPLQLEVPLLVMNGDLLTRLNFRDLLSHHTAQNADLTMTIKKFEYTIPYGVVAFDKEKRAVRIQEKPVQEFFINSGIYMINPGLLSLIPLNTYTDMNHFIDLVTASGHNTDVYQIHEYWVDIGSREELERASKDFGSVFPEYINIEE